MHLLKTTDSATAAAAGPLLQSAYYYIIAAAVYKYVFGCVVLSDDYEPLCSGRPLLHCRKWSKYLSRFN